MTSKLFTAATLVAAAQALAFDGKPARVTHALAVDAAYHVPMVTEAPVVDVRDIGRRQFTAATLFAPDNTCGYISGRDDWPYTCSSGYTCALLVQEYFGAVGCCKGLNCNGGRKTCYDYKQIHSSSSCDEDCMRDTFVVKCTATNAPYCATVLLSSSIENFYCAAESETGILPLETTYLGQTGRTFEAFVPSSSSSSTSSASASASGTEGSIGKEGDNSNGQQSSSKSSPTPVGAIVGGVIGGIALIAFIAFALWFIRRHNQKNAAGVIPPMQQAPVSNDPGYPPQPFSPTAYSAQSYQQLPTSPGAMEQKPMMPYVGINPTGVPDRHESTGAFSELNVPAIPEASGNAISTTTYNAPHYNEVHEM